MNERPVDRPAGWPTDRPANRAREHTIVVISLLPKAKAFARRWHPRWWSSVALQRAMAASSVFWPNANNPAPTVDKDDNSSLDEDPEHAPRKDEQEDMKVYETDAIHQINEAPADIHGGGDPRVRSGGRIVQEPYDERDDVGAYGIYVGNWSGRRRTEAVNNHLAADLIARNPAQVVIAQEVDHPFIDTMRDPANSVAALSKPQPVEGQGTPTVVGQGQGRNYDERPTNMTPWHVAYDDTEDPRPTNTLIVAARSSLANASTVLEYNLMFHREYKKKGKTHLAYSRILCAQVE